MAGADEEPPVGSGGWQILMRSGPSGRGANAEAVIQRKGAALTNLPLSIGECDPPGLASTRISDAASDETTIYPNSAHNLTLQPIGSILPRTIAHYRRVQLDCTLPLLKTRNSNCIALRGGLSCRRRCGHLPWSQAPVGGRCSITALGTSRGVCPGSTELQYHLLRSRHPPRLYTHAPKPDAPRDPPHAVRQHWHSPRRPAQLRPHHQDSHCSYGTAGPSRARTTRANPEAAQCPRARDKESNKLRFRGPPRLAVLAKRAVRCRAKVRCLRHTPLLSSILLAP